MNTTETNRSKKLISIVVIILCLAVCVGATYAFFTDTTTNSGNKIHAGKLKVDLQTWSSGQGWYSLAEETDPVFTQDLWEPGYTEVKLFKVVNQGTLAIQWEARLEAEYALSNLAKAIDVYVLTSDQEISYPADRAAFASWGESRGTLYDLFDKIPELINGELHAKDDCAYFGIALRMRTDADNEYRNLELGEFDIALYAAQLTHETDAFGPEYDDEADVPPAQTDRYASLSYELSDDGTYYIVTGNKTPNETRINVPETYNGLPVKAIGAYAFSYSDITELILPNTIETIGEGAFNDCYILTELNIPDSVVTIGERAFDYCDSLQTITFGENSNLKTIGRMAFYGCSLVSVTIPDGVTTIGDYAFSECYDLLYLTIPASVTSIGEEAFEYCYNILEAYNFSNSPTDGNLSAFVIYTDANATNRKTDANGYVFLEKEGSEEAYLVDYVGSATALNFPAQTPQGKTQYQIVNHAFQNRTDLTSVQIAGGVTYIGSYAFKGCTGLKELVMNVADTGHCAFYGCSALESITFGDNVTTIEYASFQDCIALTNVVIGDNVTCIDTNAFKNCSALTSVDLKNVQFIYGSAFYGCNLQSVMIPDTIIQISGEVFYGCEALLNPENLTFEGTKEEWLAVFDRFSDLELGDDWGRWWCTVEEVDDHVTKRIELITCTDGTTEAYVEYMGG